MNELDKLAPALVALQADLTPVAKSASNPFFKSSYAPLPEVMEAVQPLLAKHKLAVTQFLSNIDGISAMRTILLHESGQYIEDVQPLLLVKNDPQSQGSATTYARRYGLMSVLGVVADEDDDGNLAARAAEKHAATAKAEVPKSSATEVGGELARAKRTIMEKLTELGHDNPFKQKDYIRKVLDKTTIDNLIEAKQVADELGL